MAVCPGCLAAVENRTGTSFKSTEYNHAEHTCGKDNPSDIDTASPTSYTFDSYQNDARSTAIYRGAGTGSEGAVNYAIVGLGGEVGEILNQWQKFLRDRPDFATHPAEYHEYFSRLREYFRAELGGTLWFATILASELGYGFGEVALDNIQKLAGRKARGTIGGSGDER